jgi:acetyl-CoA decarbonylase/synthase complex subunit gamma
MAFAMKLAQKKAELGECPHASEEAQAALGAAAEPPIRLVKIGGANALEIGNETVMFRHEKTFFHATGIALELRTSQGIEAIREKVKAIEAYVPERVGEELSADLFFLEHDTEDGAALAAAVEAVKGISRKGLILSSEDRDALEKGLELLKDDRPAVYLSGKLSEADMELARAYGAALVLTAGSLEDLEAQAAAARDAGLTDLILNLEARDAGELLRNNTVLRRAALKSAFKPFGYPLLTRLRAGNPFELLADASLAVCKYSSIVVLPPISDTALLYTLFTLRQNIYTDPQKPIQVDAKVYPIGEPTADSPVFVTTNFSLTYFMVSGEIENSGISAHLVICDVEGQSVLTAWAAGKFVGETIAKFIKDIKLEDEVNTRKIVIPGFVSQISGDLEDSLPGWEVVVGPREASDIPSFVKSVALT